jgi:hypothetical protein
MGSDREKMEVAAAAGWGNKLWAETGVFSAPTTSTRVEATLGLVPKTAKVQFPMASDP